MSYFYHKQETLDVNKVKTQIRFSFSWPIIMIRSSRVSSHCHIRFDFENTYYSWIFYILLESFFFGIARKLRLPCIEYVSCVNEP